MSQTLIDVSQIKDRNTATAFDAVGTYLNSGAGTVYNTNTATAGTTVLAAQLANGRNVYLNMTGALGAGANLTTDTAAAIFAAVPGAVVGATYTLTIINSSSGAFSWTVVGGTGVTVSGTATIAQNTFRTFVVTLTSATAVTMQSVVTGTN